MNQTDVIETTAEVVPIIPTEQLAEINATDQGLATLRSRAMELSELGTPTTKEQYDEVHRITMVAVKVRTESDKLSKRLAAPYKDKYDQIRAEGKRIGDHAAASEALTRPLKEQYEAEQERLKIEAEKAAAARIQARVDSITKLGFVFDGTGYDAYGMRIDSIEVQAMPDEEWDDVWGKAHFAYATEQTRLDNLRKEQEAEAARVEAERQAEAARLQKQAEEQAVEAKRQQEEAWRLENQRAELNRMKLEVRHQALRTLGFMATQGDSMRLRLAAAQYDRNIDNADLLSMSADDFNDVLFEANTQLEREREAMRRLMVFNARSEQLVETGVYHRGEPYKRILTAAEGGNYGYSELIDLSDEDFDKLLQWAKDEQQARIVAEQKKADDDAKAAADEAKAKQKADKERTARLASDKELLLDMLANRNALPSPKLKQPEAKVVWDEFKTAYRNLLGDFKDKINTL